MDKPYWKKISECIEENTKLSCPICKDGNLKLNNSGVLIAEIPNDIEFASVKKYDFKCDNGKCNTVVMSNGKLTKYKIGVYKKSFESETFLRFFPIDFKPPLKIIHINKNNISPRLSELLDQSYNLLFYRKDKCLEYLNEIVKEISTDSHNNQATDNIESENIIDSILDRYEFIENTLSSC